MSRQAIGVKMITFVVYRWAQSVTVSTVVKYSREMAGLRLGVTLTGYHCSHVKVQRLPRFANLSCETSEVCSPRQIPTARNQILASRLAL